MKFGAMPKMMSGMMYKAACIVVIPYPYSDAVQQQKKRPVLMLTEPESFGDFVGLAITSRGHHPASVALNQEDRLSGSLPKTSWIRTDKVFTLNRSLVVKTVGEVKAALFLHARQALCGKIGCTGQ
jgi:mRNA interferase MazF